MAGNHIQPLVEPEFDAVGEKQLHADADSQERATFGDDLEDRLDKAGLFQVAHAVAKGADPGQDDTFRLQHDPAGRP